MRSRPRLRPRGSGCQAAQPASALPGESEELTKPGPAPPLLRLEAEAGAALPRPDSAALRPTKVRGPGSLPTPPA